MIVPVVAGIGRSHLDNNEGHIAIIFRKLYKPGMLLVDVGVNIGQTLLKYYSIAGNEIRYIGFEPNPTCCFYLEKFISVNKIPNSVVIPVGLGNRQSLYELFLASNGPDPGATMIDGYRDSDFYTRKKFISVMQGDEIFSELGIDESGFILKIDVEGAELEVITGLKNILLFMRPIVIMEILEPGGFSASVTDLRIKRKVETIAFMRECGYTFYNISENGILDGDSPTPDYIFMPEPI